MIIEQGAPDWMLTFGDVISLLLTFFVLLISFSTLDDERLMSVFGIVQGALGAVKVAGPSAQTDTEKEVKENPMVQVVDVGAESATLADPDNLTAVKLNRLYLRKKFEKIREKFKTIGSPALLTLQEVEEGLVFRLEIKEFFDETNQLKPETDPILREIASIVSNVENEIRLVNVSTAGIESYPDEAGSFGTWVRRMNVLQEHLSMIHDIEPSRFGISSRVATTVQSPVLELAVLDRLAVREISARELWNPEKEAVQTAHP